MSKLGDTKSTGQTREKSEAASSLKQINAKASAQIKNFEQARVSDRAVSSRRTRFDAAVSRIAT
jgi:hypothetical protein